MNCPYCAEDIREEAIICRHCAQIISYHSLAEPLNENLALLEEKVRVLEERLTATLRISEAESGHTQGYTAPDMHAQERCGALHEWPVHAVIAGFFAALASIITFQISLEAQSAGLFYLFFAFLFISTLCPFPFGVLAGIVWGGKHPWAYANIGLCSGLVSLAGHAVFLRNGVDLVPGSDWLTLAIIFPLGATLLFFAGGLLGDRLIDRLNKRVGVGLIAEDIRTLRGVVDPDTNHKERFELVKALGPAAFTLTGTLANSALVFVVAWSQG